MFFEIGHEGIVTINFLEKTGFGVAGVQGEWEGVVNEKSGGG